MTTASTERIKKDLESCKNEEKEVKEDNLSNDMAINELLKLHVELNRKLNRIREIFLKASKST